MKSKGFAEVRLGDVIEKVEERVPVLPDAEYPNFGIFSFGRGLFAKPPIHGARSSAGTLFRASAGQFVYSRLFAFEGAYGVVTPDFHGCYVSNEFPLFKCDPHQILPAFLGWLFRDRSIWTDVAKATTGMGSRRQRVQPNALLSYRIPLPPIIEQQRMVAKIDRLLAKADEVHSLVRQCEEISDGLLMSAYHEIADGAPRKPLREVAPLIRRPAVVDPRNEYPQVSVRSFGRGTFHNPPLQGSEITWQKPHLVKNGDILVSNIKAWEGAMAVAGPDDDGRFGSHRYLTFVPVDGIATANFLCFHLLSPEGLYHVGEASPGSADRNRTLSSNKFLATPIPVPSYDKQLRFDEVLSKINAAQSVRKEATVARDAMLPSILDRALKGAL